MLGATCSVECSINCSACMMVLLLLVAFPLGQVHSRPVFGAEENAAGMAGEQPWCSKRHKVYLRLKWSGLRLSTGCSCSIHKCVHVVTLPSHEPDLLMGEWSELGDLLDAVEIKSNGVGGADLSHVITAGVLLGFDQMPDHIVIEWLLWEWKHGSAWGQEECNERSTVLVCIANL